MMVNCAKSQHHTPDFPRNIEVCATGGDAEPLRARSAAFLRTHLGSFDSRIPASEVAFSSFDLDQF